MPGSPSGVEQDHHHVRPVDRRFACNMMFLELLCAKSQHKPGVWKRWARWIRADGTTGDFYVGGCVSMDIGYPGESVIQGVGTHRKRPAELRPDSLAGQLRQDEQGDARALVSQATGGDTSIKYQEAPRRTAPDSGSHR